MPHDSGDGDNGGAGPDDGTGGGSAGGDRPSQGDDDLEQARPDAPGTGQGSPLADRDPQSGTAENDAPRAPSKPTNASTSGGSISNGSGDQRALSAAEDRKLLEAAKAGDRRAWDRLARKHQRQVYIWALRLTKNEARANDLAQDTWVKAIRNLARFRGDSSFTTWMHAILKNVVRDDWRRTARRREDSFDPTEPPPTRKSAPPEPNPEDEFQERERQTCRERVMGELSKDHRKILDLRELHELSYEELSQSLHIPRGTVMSRLHHARNKFQSLFRERCPDHTPLSFHKKGGKK